MLKGTSNNKLGYRNDKKTDKKKVGNKGDMYLIDYTRHEGADMISNGSFFLDCPRKNT